MARPILLDLFCGAGGAAYGYFQAGFDVIGVDIHYQPRYPYTMVVSDVLELDVNYVRGFDVVHASPPCQAYSPSTAGSKYLYPDLIGPTRALLRGHGGRTVIENVPQAPLVDPLILCGSMFDMMRIRRHRHFECNFPIQSPDICSHEAQRDVMSVVGHSEQGRSGHTGAYWGLEARKMAMGIDWMIGVELSESIPPCYTEYIGKRIIAGA